MKKTCPVVGLTGFSGSGKTMGVIKHTHHRLDFDRQGKDSWRHARAGADVVALAAPGGVFLVRKFDSDPEPDEVLAMIDGVDLMVIEGYKQGRWPKIEVFRRGVDERPAVPREELIAVVSDETSPENGIPHFDLEDAPAVADLIERKIIFRMD